MGGCGCVDDISGCEDDFVVYDVVANETVTWSEEGETT